MSDTPDPLWEKPESGVVFVFPAAHAVDGDAMLEACGAKSCDFLWRRRKRGKDYIEFIEAKSSSPAPDPRRSSEEIQGRPAGRGVGALATYCQELGEKLNNTVLHLAAELLDRPNGSGLGLPAGMMAGTPELARWRFVLVVPNHEDAWLPPLRAAVQRAVRATVCAGRMEEPVVLNRRLARSFGLVLRDGV